MILIDSMGCGTAELATVNDWPPEVEFILSALAAGGHKSAYRRTSPRRVYRVVASLRLYGDAPDTAPRQLYTRDVGRRGLGFIARHRLPLGYGGVVRLPGPDGRVLSLDCTLSRCRQTVNGWFEGAIHFNREQYVFGMLGDRDG